MCAHIFVLSCKKSADTTSENKPDNNPNTGFVMSFAAVGIVGAAVVVSAKRKKK